MFKLFQKDKKTRARRGELQLLHGSVQTPVFMPVGTYGAVRGLSVWELESTKAEIMLCNAFHMNSRPGPDIIEGLGGLHKFNGWKKPILTDSGGFQVFSLAKQRKITDEGVDFRDPVDGRAIFFSPENVVRLQERYGSDVMMMLDECPPADADKKVIQEAVRRTSLWAERGKRSQTNFDLQLFPIFQGGVDLKLREESLRQILALEKDGSPWPGIAIGGLSVGETKPDFVKTLWGLRKSLPEEKPRYLMGVGTPRDLVFSVACGVDMFDCVMASRNARHGVVMTTEGKINILNERFKDDPRPLDENVPSLTSQTYSRAFLRHLFQVGESLGPRLLTLHNVSFYLHLMQQIRDRIEEGNFYEFAMEFLRDPKQVYLGKEADFFDFPDEY